MSLNISTLTINQVDGLRIGNMTFDTQNINNTIELSIPEISGTNDIMVLSNTKGDIHNKTIYNPIIKDYAGNNIVLPIIKTNDTFVTASSTDMLLNKTLVMPTIVTQSGAQLTLPVSAANATDILVSNTSTAELKNKTISGAFNTVEANYIGLGTDKVKISGTPKIGNTLVVTSPGIALWNDSNIYLTSKASVSTDKLTQIFSYSIEKSTVYMGTFKIFAQSNKNIFTSIYTIAYTSDVISTDSAMDFKFTPGLFCRFYSKIADNKLIINVMNNTTDVVNFNINTEIVKCTI
jgi:hypothetical protein